MSGVTWTDDRRRILGDLWKAGAPASRIASELGGGITRSAVLGFINRARRHAKEAGLPDPYYRPNEDARTNLRKVNRQAPRPRRRAIIPAHQRAVQPPAPPPPPAREEPMATILDLSAHVCCWPLGDGYCGERRARGSYCAAHGAIAYRPTAKVSDKQIARIARRFS